MKAWVISIAWVVVLVALARALRARRVRLLAAANASALPTCRCTIRRFLSWVRLPRVDAYLLDGLLVVLTLNGALRVFKRGTRTDPLPGWWFRFADVFADDVTTENDEVTVKYSGFAKGSLTLSGLPHEARQRVVSALRR